MRLNAKLPLPSDVAGPHYPRDSLGAGIVHLGVGAFHRAHQAMYTEAVLNRFGGDWRIIGVSLRSPAVRDQLAPQDCLYTLETREGDRRQRQVVGALSELLVAPENPQAVIAAIAAPCIHVVTLTITEKGYCLNATSGTLDEGHPAIAGDLASPATPATALGLLAAALAQRMAQGLPGLTLLSCDNLAGNGRLLRRALLAYCALRDPALADWVETHCRFPCSMVDRIVPATTNADRDTLRQQLGYEDRAAVFTEGFSQWVIEADFAGPVPAWDRVGAEYVDDVAPFEEMKLRLLNASHSTIAYLGSLIGCETVADAIALAPLRRAVQQLMHEESLPTLRLPADFDVDSYQQQLLARFANSALQHRCQQIAMDGSQKLPQRVLPVLQYQLEHDGPIAASTLAIAAWLRYLQGRDEHGGRYTIHDPLAAEFTDIYRQHGTAIDNYLPQFRQLDAVFPAAIAASERAFAQIRMWLEQFEQRGIALALNDGVCAP